MEDSREIHYTVLKEINISRTVPQSILDVSFGNGSFTKSVSDKLPSSDIAAIDTTIFKSFSTDNIAFIKGSVEQLPFVSESFNLVITVLSLHYWKERN